MDTMFALKIAQDPRLHFRRKKHKKIRNSASWLFVQRSFEKRNFRLFFIFYPLYLRSDTEYRVHGFVNCTIIS